MCARKESMKQLEKENSLGLIKLQPARHVDTVNGLVMLPADVEKTFDFVTKFFLYVIA